VRQAEREPAHVISVGHQTSVSRVDDAQVELANTIRI
jgi:hypothetical protein